MLFVTLSPSNDARSPPSESSRPSVGCVYATVIVSAGSKLSAVRKVNSAVVSPDKYVPLLAPVTDPVTTTPPEPPKPIVKASVNGKVIWLETDITAPESRVGRRLKVAPTVLAESIVIVSGFVVALVSVLSPVHDKGSYPAVSTIVSVGVALLTTYSEQVPGQSIDPLDVIELPLPGS